MNKQLFPVDGFAKGDLVKVGGVVGEIVGFSANNKRAEVQFKRGAESYKRWLDMEEIEPLHPPEAPPSSTPRFVGRERQNKDSETGEKSNDIMPSEVSPPAAPAAQDHPPSSSPHSVGETNPPSGSPRFAWGENTKLREMIREIQVELEALQEKVDEHEEYIDAQVEASFDVAERENEKLLTRTEVAIIPIATWDVEVWHGAQWAIDIDEVASYSEYIPDGWEFVSSQVTAVPVSGHIYFTEFVTIKREVPLWQDPIDEEDIADWNDEITQKIPLDVLEASHAADGIEASEPAS